MGRADCVHVRTQRHRTLGGSLTVSERDHRRWRIALYTYAVIVSLLMCVACAQADDALPGGITCSQVVHYASEFNIPNTTIGRLRAKVIAAALGMRLTNAQLDAAARCLARSK